MLELLVIIVLGTILGIICGLVPGLHPNAVNVILISLSPILLSYLSPIGLATLIVAVAVSNSIIDALPSIYLGAPDADSSAMNVLPGHKMLLDGKGHEAIILTITGSLFGLIFAIVSIPPLITFLSKGYPLIIKYIAFIIIAVMAFLILREKNRLWALIIFLLSGILGIATINLQIKEPLFPLFSGLFGISTLLLGLKNKVKIPKQEKVEINIKKRKIFKSVLTSLISGSIVSMLPGLGSAQGAILGSSIVKEKDSKSFLIMVGGISTIDFIISFVSIYALDKARNGSIVAVSKIMEAFTINDLIIFIAIALVVGGISTIIAMKMSKLFSTYISMINYNILSLTIIAGLTIAVLIISGFIGVIVLFTAIFLGMLPDLKETGKSHLMGSLILPVILFFLL
ncbi:tripartite tricarboxylate transporter permease [Candidatus Woesearchaeota archaeon]|nr:tripartite tricarboxylate transporter permease [Candidatus Woesearchaeota archaeon]